MLISRLVAKERNGSIFQITIPKTTQFCEPKTVTLASRILISYWLYNIIHYIDRQTIKCCYFLLKFSCFT